MFRFHNRLNAVLFKPFVRSHTAAFEIHLDKIFGQPYLHLFTYEVERYGVFVEPVRDQIVISDYLLFPHRWLKRPLRQRQHEFLFLGKICFSAAAGSLLKRLCIDDFKPFCNSVPHVRKREELALTQSSGYPSS